MGSPYFKNWKVVVLSFLGACTFWLFSALGKEYSTRVFYPINFLYDRDSLIPVEPLPKYLDLGVTSNGWNLFRHNLLLHNSPISIILEDPVNTRLLQRGTLLAHISEQVKIFELDYLFTNALEIHIQKREKKIVLLKIDSLQINMEDNYRIISDIQIIPDTATIFGPSGFIDTLNTEYHLPMEFKNIDNTINRYVRIDLPDKLEIRADPRAVKVFFAVDRFDKLTIPIEVKMIGFPEDSSVYVDEKNIEIQFVIQQSLKKDYFSEDFIAIVDYELINPQDSLVPIFIAFYPENILEIQSIPDSIPVIYEK